MTRTWVKQFKDKSVITFICLTKNVQNAKKFYLYQCFIKIVKATDIVHGVKKCKGQQVKLRRQNRALEEKTIPDEKCCSICKETKNADCFSRLKTSKDGLSLFCKTCRMVRLHHQRKTRKENPIVIDDTKLKKCFKCDHTKCFTEFPINRRANDNVSNICIDCTPKSQWTREKQYISEKKYREKYPDKVREKYKRQGMKINRRIRDSLNHRIAEALQTKNVTKRNRTVE